MVAWTSRRSRSSTFLYASYARSLPPRRVARTTSKRYGAGGTCCVSRRRLRRRCLRELQGRPRPRTEKRQAMNVNLKKLDIGELRPRITIFGVGGAGGNVVNNMINAGLQGVDFVVANTDAQALTTSRAERIIQLGVTATEGLGAGSQPDVGRAAAEEVIDEIRDHLTGAHMVFVTAGMGGGTGTGACGTSYHRRGELGILTVGVVTKPFHFEGLRRMR